MKNFVNATFNSEVNIRQTIGEKELTKTICIPSVNTETMDIIVDAINILVTYFNENKLNIMNFDINEYKEYIDTIIKNNYECRIDYINYHNILRKLFPIREDYLVTVSEIVERTYKLKATSMEEAENIVKDSYNLNLITAKLYDNEIKLNSHDRMFYVEKENK